MNTNRRRATRYLILSVKNIWKKISKKRSEIYQTGVQSTPKWIEHEQFWSDHHRRCHIWIISWKNRAALQIRMAHLHWVWIWYVKIQHLSNASELKNNHLWINSFSHHRIQYLIRPKEICKINRRHRRLPIIYKHLNKCNTISHNSNFMVHRCRRHKCNTSIRIHLLSHKWCYIIRAIRLKVKKATSKTIQHTVCQVQRAIWATHLWISTVCTVQCYPNKKCINF